MLSEQEIALLDNPKDIPLAEYRMCLYRAARRTEWHAYEEFAELKRNSTLRIDAHTEGNIFQPVVGRLNLALLAGEGRQNAFPILIDVYNRKAFKTWQDTIQETEKEKPSNYGEAITDYILAYAISVFFENLRREICAYRNNMKLDKIQSPFEFY